MGVNWNTKGLKCSATEQHNRINLVLCYCDYSQVNTCMCVCVSGNVCLLRGCWCNACCFFMSPLLHVLSFSWRQCVQRPEPWSPTYHVSGATEETPLSKSLFDQSGKLKPCFHHTAPVCGNTFTQYLPWLGIETDVVEERDSPGV